MIPAAPDEPSLLADILGRVRAHKGPEAELPGLYRVLGNAPAMLDAWIAFAWPLRLEARSPRGVRELLILRGAQLCDATYEWAHHVPMALDAGITVEQVRALEDWRRADGFDARERAALRLADEVCRGPGASAGCLRELAEAGFTDEERVELVLTASFYVCVARLLTSMAVDLEPGYERYLDAGACRLPPGFTADKLTD